MAGSRPDRRGAARSRTRFGQGGQDDTYITYWPARALAEHGEIVNYNGIRLEQSSSLSLVVLLALLFELMPLSMPSVGYLTSLAGAASPACWRSGWRGAWGSAPASGSSLPSPRLRRSGTGRPAAWRRPGSPSPRSGSSAFSRLRRHARTYWARLATAALLFAGIRPEAPLLLGGLCVVSVALTALRHRTGEGDALSPSASLQRASASLAAIVFVFAFRKLYFDAWWPNPALIKTGGFDPRDGAQYLWEVGIQAGLFPILLFLAGAVLVVTRSPVVAPTWPRW